MRTGKRCLIAVFFIAVYGFCAASAVAETVSSPDVILNYSLPLTGSTTTLESSNGEIKLYYSQMRKVLKSSATFSKAIKELESKNWIKTVDQGGLYQRASTYSLTFYYDKFR